MNHEGVLKQPLALPGSATYSLKHNTIGNNLVYFFKILLSIMKSKLEEAYFHRMAPRLIWFISWDVGHYKS